MCQIRRERIWTALAARRVSAWMARSLDCLEKSKTALAARRASAWMARVRVGHRQALK